LDDVNVCVISHELYLLVPNYCRNWYYTVLITKHTHTALRLTTRYYNIISSLPTDLYIFSKYTHHHAYYTSADTYTRSHEALIFDVICNLSILTLCDCSFLAIFIIQSNFGKRRIDRDRNYMVLIRKNNITALFDDASK